MRRETWSQERRQKTRVKLSPALTHRLHIDNSGTKTLILIKGGRWLLTASDLGSVSYYDLETREPVERSLIPKKRERDSDGSFHVVKMDVDIDDESAVLSFNLALCLGDGGFFYLFSRILISIWLVSLGFYQSIRTQIVQVWCVTLQLDGQNHGTSLSATHLSSFPRENCGSLRAISLLGTSIAFGVRTTGNDPGIPHYVAIVNWAEANVQAQGRSHRNDASELSYPRKVISTYASPVSGSVGSLFIYKFTKVNRFVSDYSRGTRYFLLYGTIDLVFTTDPLLQWQPAFLLSPLLHLGIPLTRSSPPDIQALRNTFPHRIIARIQAPWGLFSTPMIPLRASLFLASAASNQSSKLSR